MSTPTLIKLLDTMALDVGCRVTCFLMLEASKRLQDYKETIEKRDKDYSKLNDLNGIYHDACYKFAVAETEDELEEAREFYNKMLK